MNPRHRFSPLPAIRRGRAARTGSRGQALVEVALIVPVMLLLLVAAGDLARVFSARVTIESAARAGALEASLHPTSYQANQPCDAQVNRVICAVLTESSGSVVGIRSEDVVVACVPSPCSEALGSEVHVSVVGHVQLLTPILAPFTGGQAFDTTATAAAQIAVRPNIAAGSPAPTSAPTPTPTPTPAPTPTPGPSATPGPTPTPSPTPSPTPFCASPVADFSISPTSGKKKKTTFQFTDLSSSGPLCPLTWSWNFGDGAGASSTSTAQNPTHMYDAQGTYTVTLVASNAGGSATRTRTVTVTP